MSRRCPANSCQGMHYTCTGNRHFNDPKVTFRLVSGEEDPNWETITGQVRPRVKRGSSVIVFTHCNQNMKMVFSYSDLCKGRVTQETKFYTTSASFQMGLGDWIISVLDPVDNMMMLYSIEWEDDDGDETGTGGRVAYVYCCLEEARDYRNYTRKRTQYVFYFLHGYVF